MSDPEQLNTIHLNKNTPVISSQHADQTTEPKVTYHPLGFTGNTSEYFRIWIVNLALTIITFGIYTPWARVRTRQYFYRHTWLDNHTFEYTANPLILLRGYILVMVLAGIYSIAPEIQFKGWEIVTFGILALFILIYPWLIRQSLKFNAKSTIYRGLGFRFHGRTSDSYVAYGLANIAAGITGYLALPWAWFMQRRYQIDNVSFGTAKGRFRGDLGEFYKIGLIGFAISVASFAVIAILAIVPAVIFIDRSELETGFDDSMALFALIIPFYLAFLLITVIVWEYVRSATMKYVLENIELGGVVRLGTTLNVQTLVKIGIGNALATVFSLGLLIPWAQIRRTKYVLENIQVRTITDLDHFQADVAQDESALGEVAADLLDIDVGF